MLKNTKILLLIVFSMISTFLFSVESKFMSVGNIKIVRPNKLSINREDINITIEKNGEISVNTYYIFENKDDYEIKETFMFWLDKNIPNNTGNKQTNIKKKYIKNIKFLSENKKTDNLRAVINFDEKIYSNQVSDNIQRDWFAITKTIEAGDSGNLRVRYKLNNIEDKKVVFSFDLVDNFIEKNKVKDLNIVITNKSDKEILDVYYKGYQFKKSITKKEDTIYELYARDVELDNKMIISFK